MNFYIYIVHMRGEERREREREIVNENNKTMQQTQTRRNVFCEKVAAKNTEVAAKVIH